MRGRKVRVFTYLRSEGQRKKDHYNQKSDKENNKEDVLLRTEKVVTLVFGRKLERERSYNESEENKSQSPGSLVQNKLRVIVSYLSLTVCVQTSQKYSRLRRSYVLSLPDLRKLVFGTLVLAQVTV